MKKYYCKKCGGEINKAFWGRPPEYCLTCKPEHTARRIAVI